MTLTVASAYLDDGEFLQAVADCSLPASAFRHGDHLRLAWLLVHRHSFSEALLEVRRSIMRLAVAFGAEGLFHETMTRAWVSLVATHDEATFVQFLEAHQQRLNLDLLHRFWSPELLNSDAARLSWVAPDRASHAGFAS